MLKYHHSTNTKSICLPHRCCVTSFSPIIVNVSLHLCLVYRCPRLSPHLTPKHFWNTIKNQCYVWAVLPHRAHVPLQAILSDTGPHGAFAFLSVCVCECTDTFQSEHSSVSLSLNWYFLISPLFPHWLSVSAARGFSIAFICGLPTDSTGVIILYVLIGVNTKMEATPACVTSQLQTAHLWQADRTGMFRFVWKTVVCFIDWHVCILYERALLIKKDNNITK